MSSAAKILKLPVWPTVSPPWNEACINLLRNGSTSQTANVNLKNLMEKSRKFPITFPIITNTCQNLIPSVDKEILERNIKSAYPVIHETVLNLCARFLLFKLDHGTDIEKKLYKNMTVKCFIDRLLKKRAVSFMMENDMYLLLDKSKGTNNWESIGTRGQRPPLIMKNCLTYDEIKVAAFLSVSSYNYFMNDGSRYNDGVVAADRANIQPEGIIVGLIGKRLEKQEVMEYEELIISHHQNTEERGYGGEKAPASLHRLFADFYEDTAFTYREVRDSSDDRFVDLQSSGLYFDNVAYAKRLALSFDTLLIEANHRAREQGVTAYIHVMGIGLGVWKVSGHQYEVFVETFGKRLSFLGARLPNVSDVHFAYISGVTNCAGHMDGDLFPIEGHPKGGITIHISRRELFSKLAADDKLLVVSYAWDGNALPGNEYWLGMLGSSGDPSTAAASQIAELHNPHINELVCGDNLKVATLRGEVLSLQDYVDQMQKSKKMPFYRRLIHATSCTFTGNK